MQMQPPLPLYVPGDGAAFTLPYAIDMTPQEDSQSSELAKEDDLGASEPIDVMENDPVTSESTEVKVKDEIPLPVQKKWGSSIIVACVGMFQAYAFCTEHSVLTEKKTLIVSVSTL